MLPALGAALGFWWWLLPKEPKYYYYAWLSTPSYGLPLLPSGGLVLMTRRQAEEWRLDLMEQYWSSGAQVDLYQWDQELKSWQAAA